MCAGLRYSTNIRPPNPPNALATPEVRRQAEARHRLPLAVSAVGLGGRRPEAARPARGRNPREGEGAPVTRWMCWGDSHLANAARKVQMQPLRK